MDVVLEQLMFSCYKKRKITLAKIRKNHEKNVFKAVGSSPTNQENYLLETHWSMESSKKI